MKRLALAGLLILAGCAPKPLTLDERIDLYLATSAPLAPLSLAVEAHAAGDVAECQRQLALADAEIDGLRAYLRKRRPFAGDTPPSQDLLLLKAMTDKLPTVRADVAAHADAFEPGNRAALRGSSVAKAFELYASSEAALKDAWGDEATWQGRKITAEPATIASFRVMLAMDPTSWNEFDEASQAMFAENGLHRPAGLPTPDEAFQAQIAAALRAGRTTSLPGSKDDEPILPSVTVASDGVARERPDPAAAATWRVTRGETYAVAEDANGWVRLDVPAAAWLPESAVH